ncbi:AbrB/MazE/SpoVT family DNA-binding domain-containing protein [Hymenobacter sp. BT664]|uniref:AbrB/MazE/SpoVT family DNA-binding domain-containing protein n=1 Tax=Hymenobacter montanus TaxID=2771359 RepID=A0A927GLF0_9BACT|nr:AbrB/MazE/SpoVT family DNA-binding domain-containing protein [Hymenobacter montanus]MBD2770532.1 AbrB/MazE/SpoVT family DNA-binding domain-containing protein [Hymenobacter montanus]
MHTRIIRVGNSQGIVLPKKLLQQYHLSGAVELQPMPEGLLIKPVTSSTRQGWEAQMQAAVAAGQEPAGELLEGFSDGVFEENEWQW